MECTRNWKLKLVISLAVSGVFTFSGNSAFTQVNSQLVPDGTLGAERSIVTPDVLNGIPIDRIDGGAKQGINLFHSFQEFNVDAGKGVYFQNPSGIENILSRVTGNNPSRIFGKLGVLGGNANLFLINSQGIIFGSGASLNVGGSFVATTANAIQFNNQGFFSASISNIPLTLTVNPSALLFNQIAVGDITNNSSGLEVLQGRSLLLVGGNVNFDGGTLDVSDGQVELGGVSRGTVGLSVNGSNLSLSYPQGVQLADISFTDGSVVRARGSNVYLQAKRVKLTESSQILSTSLENNSSGNLIVNASESVELIGADSSLVSSTITAGDAGNITINTRRLLLEDEAFVATDPTFFIPSPDNSFDPSLLATGRAGNLTVNASDSVELKDSSLSSQTLGSGDAGNITLNTARFLLKDSATVSARTFASGRSGNIILQAQVVLLQNESSISTSAGNPDTPGNGGNITIKADTLVGVENSNITTNAFNGRGGRIRIDAQGIFGLEVIDTINDINELEDNSTSDISAASQQDPLLNGEVEINRPEIDPSSGLVTLPTELVDVSGLIAQGCSAGGGNVARGSKFVATGRGGLPPTPTEALRSDAALADLGTPVQGDRASAASTNPTTSQPTPLVEAQGWVIGSKGEVVLIAQAPTVTPHTAWLTPTTCNGS